ncbi:Aldo/keto reductase family [Musa troglodytarum]|uniref:Aldo/keto reductase family n=1 Tax=Musa troglodytarum TaxID=320322 RepID=A0A9E7II24_9LILI|nr:Aldo/keto reductase family [Musa troglodytarum]
MQQTRVVHADVYKKDSPGGPRFHLREGLRAKGRRPDRVKGEEEEEEEEEEEMAQALHDAPSAQGDLRYFKLVSGHSIPSVGLGTWKSASSEASHSVYTAITEVADLFPLFFLLPCFPWLGIGMWTQLHYMGFKKRCTDLSPDRVQNALQQTLKELQLDYLDLYLIHWPFHLKEGATRPPRASDMLDFDMEGVWREMEKQVKDGLVRDIGVSNFTLKKLNKLLKCAQIMPSVCQMEMHPGWRNDKILEACKNNGIHVTVRNPQLPGGFHARTPPLTDLLLAGLLSTGIFEKTKRYSSESPLTQVSKKLNKTPGQVLLKWALQRGTSVIPKSTNADRIKGNIQVFGWAIPKGDFEALNGMSDQRRAVDGEEIFVNKSEGPYKSVAELWDDEA